MNIFNLFINDVTDQANNNITIKLFADDIKIYTDIQNTHLHNFQKQLDNIHLWSSTWQMQISHSEGNILQIGSSTSSHTFHFINNTIQQVDSVIDSGVTIDNNLRFKYHINNITLKANQRAALIKRCFLSRNPNNLIRAFKIYVRPILGIRLHHMVAFIHFANHSN